MNENKQKQVYDKEYYIKNKDKIKERTKRYREENKDKVAETQKEYYKANKERISEYKRKRYLENKEEIRVKQNKYNEEHKETRKEYKRKNREAILKHNSMVYNENKKREDKRQKERNTISKRNASNHMKAWTHEEDVFLLKCRENNMEYIKIAEMLGRSLDATFARYRRLTQWTEKEKAELLRLAGSGLNCEEISKELKRPCLSISLEYKYLTGKHISI